MFLAADPLWFIVGGITLKCVIVLGIFLNVVPLLVYAERKISAYIQGRLGPNRVGPGGLLQTLADGVKLAFKEEIIPKDADVGLYLLAPCLAIVFNAAAFAFIPLGPHVSLPEDSFTGSIDMRIAPGSLGVLALLATSSLGVYGISLAGWASNSKYPLMGAVRAAAQMISYSVALGLALLAVIATAGSVDLQQVVADQTRPLTDLPGFGHVPNWHIFHQPIAFIIFLVAMFAENNRLPFDLSEAEPELGAGFHTEYSGLKFAMFFMGEYIAMITMSALCVTLFFGGWDGPGMHTLGTAAAPSPMVDGLGYGLLGLVYFSVKVLLILGFYIWVRWTFPRFRYDQLMRLGWKMLIPIGLANFLLTGVILAL